MGVIGIGICPMNLLDLMQIQHADAAAGCAAIRAVHLKQLPVRNILPTFAL
jgi:hypothetical protein